MTVPIETHAGSMADWITAYAAWGKGDLAQAASVRSVS